MSKVIKDTELLIIGGGPAGLSAAIYGSRAKLDTLLLESSTAGGQVRSSYSIENYPGFKMVEGNTLADLMEEQAREAGTVIEDFVNIQRVTLEEEGKLVETYTEVYRAEAVIIATGATPKKLPLPDEARFSGKGIHYCAVCDGAMYEGSVLAVVGGGNSALEEALFLTRFAEKVIMIRRYDYFKGEKRTLEVVVNHPKIEIMYNWDLINVMGKNFVESAIIRNTRSGEVKNISLDGVFGYIGTEPKTGLFKGAVNLNKEGYIPTDENMQTNIKGVYAAGDVREKQFRQISTAVADGTIAALSAEKFIVERKRKSSRS